MDALRRAAVEPAGPVIFVYYGIEANPTQEFDLDICVPTAAETAIPTEAPTGCKMLGAFECIAADFNGSMHGMQSRWGQVAEAWRRLGAAGVGAVTRGVQKVDQLRLVRECNRAAKGNRQPRDGSLNAGGFTSM